MRSNLMAVMVALVALAGCSSDPPAALAPAEPGPRMLIESQVIVFVDRSIALDPDSPGLVMGRDRWRDAIEREGRAVCSHMIAGVKPNMAFAAAYPDAGRITPQSIQQQRVQLAAELLCPTT